MKSKKNKVEIPDIGMIMPIVDFDENLKIGIMKDGTYVDCMKITSKDLINTDDIVSKLDCAAFEKLYSTYSDSLKIVSSYFPVDTKNQIRYYRYILENTENPVYKSFIEDEIRKAEVINKEMLSREFLIYFYAKNILDYNEKFIKLSSVYSNGRKIFEQISAEKKKKHFFLLANKNLNY